MESGNSDLRAELRRITTPPDGADLAWLDVEIHQIDELHARFPHSVRVHTRCSDAICELNCFMFALGIEMDAVRDMCLGKVFPGKRFVRYILAAGLLHERTSQGWPADGDIVIYLRAGEPEHAGKWNAGKVISKWGGGRTHIWEHDLWDVPTEYGNEVRFFAHLTAAVDVYRAWATRHGL